ncbi:hypothetical protein BDV98DRAFT_548024 [Pterulicium gracile]|uniref:Asparagine--tRNA ligase, mitochondrial n=1 Tax=Pterulicium gracile TaxID=1884261 RepID=A0A5C3QJK3_9AGAR|nr:hypothetical protein BDV98DRAFT_548024 [Pterula gracilis]
MIFRRYASTHLPRTIQQLLSAPPIPPNLSQVSITGWVKSVRRQKRVAFAVVNDGSNAAGLQVVFSDPISAQRLSNGTAVRLTGQLADSPGKGQAKELKVEQVQVLGECDPEEYPIQKQALSTEYLRQNVHLRARTDTIASMIRLRDSLQRSIHAFFQDEGFLYTHTPILTSNDCEGAGEAFQIASQPSSQDGQPSNTLETTEKESVKESHFFSRPTYLTVSSQLHLEAMATAMSRVYTLSPCFRAETSQTNRHLSEFWMLEAEWAFTERVEDICSLVEALLKSTWKHSCQERIGLADEASSHLAHIAPQFEQGKSWQRMTYTEAISELSKHQSTTKSPFVFDPKWGKPLQSEHERWLADTLVRGPVFVTDYPTSLKPFYMRANPDGKTVACFDLLIPQIGELVGGSLREERLDVLKENMVRHNLSPELYGWYLDLRKYGGAPHGGFGLGLERLVSWMGAIENIRECIPMPRWAGRMLL